MRSNALVLKKYVFSMSLGDASMCLSCHTEINPAFTQASNPLYTEVGAYEKLPKILVFDSSPAPGVDITGGVLTLTASLYHEDDEQMRVYRYYDQGDPALHGKGFYLDIKAIAQGGAEYPLPATYTIDNLAPTATYINDPAPVTGKMMIGKKMSLSINTAALPGGTYTLSITPHFEGHIDCAPAAVGWVTSNGVPHRYHAIIDGVCFAVPHPTRLTC